MSRPSVSVVIPAYNCEKTIALSLQALQSQTVFGIEIIVVDDGSIDQTAEIIKRFPRVSYVYQGNAGPASARNRGAKVAQGEFIFFTDSDCVPQKDWIEKSLPHFQSPDVGAVCGSYGIANPGMMLARCIHQEIVFRHKNLLPQYPKVFGSYNVAVRKALFEQLGGFDESYRRASGEDNDLSYKILKQGFKIYFERESLVDHFHTASVAKYLREQFRHGFWRARMYRAHPQMMKGDDYTFWKDMVEVLLSVGILLSLPIFFIAKPFAVVGAACFLALIFIELFFGIFFTRRLGEGLFYAFVMFFRSLARTIGFLYGWVAQSLIKFPKKT